jgi:hypothetical protein
MRWSGPVVAIVAAAAVAISVVVAWAADDKDRPFGGPPPNRSTEERPFGGPPPNDRVIQFKKAGKKCATATGSCALEKAQAVGTVCSCPNGTEPAISGKVEQ